MRLLVALGAHKFVLPVSEDGMCVKELKRVIAERWKKRDPTGATQITSLCLGGFELDDDDLVRDVLTDGVTVEVVPIGASGSAPAPGPAPAVLSVPSRNPVAAPAPASAPTSFHVPPPTQLPSKAQVASFVEVVMLERGAMMFRPTRDLVDGTTTLAIARQNIGKVLGLDPSVRECVLYTAQHPLWMDATSETHVTLADAEVTEHDTLYAVVRDVRAAPAAAAAAATDATKLSGGWLGNFSLSHWWQPSRKQTDAALCKFLSVLYVIVSHVSKLDTTRQLRLLGYLRKVSFFPPTISALYYLFKRCSIADAEKAAIAEGLFHLFRAIVPASVVRDDTVFDCADTCWAFLLEEGAKGDAEKTEVFRSVSVTCPLSFTRLENPVRFPNSPEAMSLEAVRKTLADGTKKLPGYPGAQPTIEDAVPDRALQVLLLCCPSKTTDIHLWDLNKTDAKKAMAKCELPKILCDWEALQRKKASLQCLTLYVGIAMKNATAPALCLYEDGTTVVYCDRSKDVNLSYVLFHPLKGEQLNANPDVLATKLTKIGISATTVPARVDTRKPEEAIVVLLDVSGSMNSVFSRQTGTTRIEAVKQFFHAFSNRSMAYNFPHHIGLILFGTNVTVACPLTPLFENFKSTVDRAVADGRTSLHDALVSATDLLRTFRQRDEQNRSCALRVLCLTDGSDTASKTAAYCACAGLQSMNIRVDSFILGSEDSASLRAITVATGGLCFHPESLLDGMKLFEIEAVLALKERAVMQAKPLVANHNTLEEYGNLAHYPYTISPQRPPPTQLSKPVTTAGQILRQAVAHRPVAGRDPAPKVERTRRILKELHQLCVTRPHPAVHVFPCAENIGFWRVLMIGPEGTPYANGTFLLYVQFPDTYPVAAPEVRAVTRILHVNINADGKICHSVFDRNWTSDTSMYTVMSCVYGLLLTPEPDDPLDSVLAEEYLMNRAAYDQKAREMTLSQANKTLQQWRAELNVEDDGHTAADASAAATIPPPEHLCDPITRTLFVDPVMTRYGHTYERATIEQWIAKNGTDPLTRQPLGLADLTPNLAIKAAADDFRKTAQSSEAPWWN